jgi:hypothetical protein
MIDLFHDEIPEASIVEDPSSFQKCFRVNSISIESMLRNAFVCRAHTNVCCLLDRQHGARKIWRNKITLTADSAKSPNKLRVGPKSNGLFESRALTSARLLDRKRRIVGRQCGVN